MLASEPSISLTEMSMCAQEVLKLSQDQKKQLAGARREYLQALGPILDKQQALLAMLEVRGCSRGPMCTILANCCFAVITKITSNKYRFHRNCKTI